LADAGVLVHDPRNGSTIVQIPFSPSADGFEAVGDPVVRDLTALAPDSDGAASR